MRGFATDRRGEPIVNAAWINPPKSKAPGWGINGPGVSAEWTQGGESEWNSAAASADETYASIHQDIEIPSDGDYKVWVRYADWANKTENFKIRIAQEGNQTTRGHGEGETGGREDAETRRRADTETRRGGDAEKFSASPRPRVPGSPRLPVAASPRHPIRASVSFAHEFGTRDIFDPHDEVSMYWGWAFTWDGFVTKLQKGPARILIEIEKAAEARRHVDSVVVTNDPAYVPQGRRKPDFAGMRYLRTWAASRNPLAPLATSTTPTVASASLPAGWQRPRIAGRDFLMPWNIAKEFWPLLDKPPAERPLYPFNAEPLDQFIEKYKGAREVPIFASKLVVPVIYIPNLPEYLREGSPLLRYLRETKSPFAVLINYGTAQFSPEEGAAAWKLLNGELRDQFLGWVSGESVGYVWDSAAKDLKVSASMSRRELLDAYRLFYTNALDKKWSTMFQASTGPMWNQLIPAQSTSSTSFAHALAGWGVRLLGMETAAVQPMFAMRIAFTRGAARQYGGAFAYYHAPNFGDTATTFTNAQNFAGPNNFFHSRYGATMGPSLSWYRKSYYLYYMSGASAIYLEQGADQFFKPGPGEHPFQLNPLGRITDEFMRFAENHPDRGTPYTPIAFLLDPAHGWDMTDYPHWPFGVSPINRRDRALRELFGVAYFPGLVVEGEPATGDRQAFVNGIFGDIFDVLVADSQNPTSNAQSPTSNVPGPTSNTNTELFTGTAGVSPADLRHHSTSKGYAAPPPNPLKNYRAVVVGGHIDWSPTWIQKISDYVRGGGVLVVNAAQIKGLPAELLGIKSLQSTLEADAAKCLREPDQNLIGQVFRYEKNELKGATTLIASPTGESLVTINKVGKGTVVFSALPDLLGLDERVTPFAAHMLAHIFADATPVKVRGDVEYLINRTASSWVVTLFNNNGIFKPQQGLAQVDRGAVVNVTISIPAQQLRTATDWISDKPLEVKKPGEVTVTLAPGAVAIVELQ